MISSYYRIFSNVILLVFLTVLLGCSTTLTKKYSYTDVSQSCAWGRLDVKLAGTMTTVNGDNIVGTPYELFLGFYPLSTDPGQVIIHSIQLIDEAGEIVYVNNTEIKKNYSKENSNSVFFMYGNLELDYKKYNLKINYEVRKEKSTTNNLLKAYIKFEQNYQESRSSVLWDRLMSV